MSDHRARQPDLTDAEGLGLLRRELSVRWSLLRPDSEWRDPDLFGDQLDSDAHWILAGRWDSYCAKPCPTRIHPLLGWTQGHMTADNPMGLEPETRSRLRRDGRPKVLFYGDSYVGGHAARENWLPFLLDRQLDGADVLHLGVGGYGTDQMHLLFRETVPMVDAPRLVLMGVMPFSFDRVALRVRSYQKPVLVVGESGDLEVANVPIDPRPRRFYRRARLGFRSYLRAAIRHRRVDGPSVSFDEKARINGAILDANVRLAREVGAEIAYVIFHDRPQLTRPDERAAFFRDELASRGIATFDTAEPLLAHAERAGTDASELYADGHHNDLGNRVLADAMGGWLAGLIAG